MKTAVVVECIAFSWMHSTKQQGFDMAAALSLVAEMEIARLDLTVLQRLKRIFVIALHNEVAMYVDQTISNTAQEHPTVFAARFARSRANLAANTVGCSCAAFEIV